MKKFFLSFFLIIFVRLAFAQALFNNNGADIYVKDGAFVIVKTNSIYNNQISGAGFIDNAGTIVIEGNITNDGNIAANGDTIRLSGDWINNNAYAGNNSWVEMNGGAQQITGSAVTTFNNLNLMGGGVVKRQTINAVTSGELRLNDAELATDVNEMLVSNSANNALTRSTGFVSSAGVGKLSRATALASVYLFPVGSPSYNNPPSIFRPVEFTPSTSAANTYGAMVVKGDATFDGYDVHKMDDLLCLVNPHFYHRLYHSSGNDAIALKMFFDPTADGNWTDEAHWSLPSSNQWNYLDASTALSGLGFSAVSVSNINNFTPNPFALARKKFTVNAGSDVEITVGESASFSPIITASTVASYNWAPAENLSCNNCESPTASPAVTTEYILIVTDEAGCVVADSLLVKVSSPELLIPTAFSPNGDGVNDIFRVLNKNLTKFNLQLYNRWGEMVFETNDFSEGWDGVYQGIQQPLGVYVWQCEYLFAGTTKKKTAKGNITLVR